MSTSRNIESLEGWSALTAAQRGVLRELHAAAEWHSDDGLGVQLIAWERQLPVVYIFDSHEAFVVESDGTLRASPEPVA
jgi:hypothetical protein